MGTKAQIVSTFRVLPAACGFYQKNASVFCRMIGIYIPAVKVSESSTKVAGTPFPAQSAYVLV